MSSAWHRIRATGLVGVCVLAALPTAGRAQGFLDEDRIRKLLVGNTLRFAHEFRPGNVFFHYSADGRLERYADRLFVRHGYRYWWTRRGNQLCHLPSERGPRRCARITVEGDRVTFHFVGQTDAIWRGHLFAGKWLPPAWRPLPPVERDRLTRDELTRGQTRRPVDNLYYTPLAGAGPAKHAFSGIVSVAETPMKGFAPRAARRRPDLATFPAFTASFFSEGDRLVPVERGVINSYGESYWRVLLSPGRVWSEPTDGGMSRASFPFALIHPGDSELHNGIATFLFDDRTVSPLRYQIVQQTNRARKIDLWGALKPDFRPGPLPDDAAVRAAFREEVEARMSIRPLSDLGTDRAAGIAEAFTRDLWPHDISAAGLVVDGTLYLDECRTLYGPYPYCREMRHASYSLSKSLVAAVAMLRLARKYGDDVFELRIADYLKATATHNGWDQVTFGDVLSMATGIGDEYPTRSPNRMWGDNAEVDKRYRAARSAADKVAAVFGYGNYPWGPGEVVRYRSSQTFVLAAAMDAYLKSREGPAAHIWNMLVNEVYRPIGIVDPAIATTAEPDGRPGIPLMAGGFWPTAEHVAKIATLLQNGGWHRGRQILSATKLREAMFGVPGVGLPTGEQRHHGEYLYHMSFYLDPPEPLRDGCEVQAPYGAGWGGNTVVLARNGITAIRFMDARSQPIPPLLRAIDLARPLCPGAPGDQAAKPPGSPLGIGDVTPSLRLVGNPLLARYPAARDGYPRNVWDLKAFDGRLYIGHGDFQANAGPIDVWYLDPASGKFVKDGTVPDEQISGFRVIGGRLVAAGIDPRDGWELGNFYRLENGAWSTVRTLPNAIHTFDLLDFRGRLYAALGTDDGAAVAASTDGGKSWNIHNLRPNAPRIRARARQLFVLDGALHVSSVGPGSAGIHRLSGEKFDALAAPGFFPTAPFADTMIVQHDVRFRGQAAYIGTHKVAGIFDYPVGVYAATGTTPARALALPTNVRPEDIAVAGDRLYVLTNERTADGFLVRVFDTGDLKELRPLFGFRSAALARSFEIMDGDFYFGLGTSFGTERPEAGNLLRLRAADIPPLR